MILRRIGPLSLAKISGTLYVCLGFLAGGVVSLISIVVSTVRPGQEAGPFAALFGVGAVIWLPLFYGTIGFIGSLIMAGLYNLVAGWVGGIRLELQPLTSQVDAPRP